MSAFNVGDQVRHSGHVIMRARDYWLSCGREPMKSGAAADLEKKTKARGTVTEVIQGAVSLHVKIDWNDGHKSDCLTYMVEKVQP